MRLALTLDDGPVPQTAELLDLLAAHGTRATFFLVGTNVAAHPELVARMAGEGHAVGNHSYDHPDLTTLPIEEVRRQLASTNDVIEAATGVRPTLFRPPFGAIDPAVAQVCAELGLAQVLWSVDPSDWRDHDPDLVAARVLDGAFDGAIVLTHDVQPTTRQAYPAILTALASRGCEFLTVPQLLGEPEPGAVHSRA